MAYCYHCMTEINSDNAVYCPECGKKYNEHFAQSNELPAGTIIGNGRYLVGISIGSGGFGITYIGCDLNIGKKILIKETFYNGIFRRNCYDKSTPDFLSITYTSDISFETILRKTRKECETLAKAEKLDNIVKVYDYFTENNTTYLVTEFIEGITLGEKVKANGRYSWNELYTKIKPLMLSLAELHEMGILHRDIKPENIMLKSTKHSGDRFILIDFGLAHTVAHNTVATKAVSFSPGYAPCEQRIMGSVEGAFVDVYSIAATIYFAVTGETPYTTIDDVVDENFPKLSRLSSDYGVPQNVVQTLYNALNPDYRKRLQSISQLIEGFENGNATSMNVSAVNNTSKQIFNNSPSAQNVVTGTQYASQTSGYNSVNLFDSATQNMGNVPPQFTPPAHNNNSVSLFNNTPQNTGNVPPQFTPPIHNNNSVNLFNSTPQNVGNVPPQFNSPVPNNDRVSINKNDSVSFGNSSNTQNNYGNNFPNNSVNSNAFSQNTTVYTRARKKGSKKLLVIVLVIAVFVGVGFAVSSTGGGGNTGTYTSSSINDTYSSGSSSAQTDDTDLVSSTDITSNIYGSSYEYDGIEIVVPSDYTIDDKTDPNGVYFYAPDVSDNICLTSGDANLGGEFMTEESVNKSMEEVFENYKGCEGFRKYKLGGCDVIRYHHTITYGDCEMYQSQMAIYFDDHIVFVTCTSVSMEYIDEFNDILDNISIV